MKEATNQVISDFGDRSDISVNKICFSKKYNTCILEYKSTPTQESVKKSISEDTEFKDVLSGEVVEEKRLNTEDGKMVYYVNGPNGMEKKDWMAYQSDVLAMEKEICAE